MHWIENYVHINSYKWTLWNFWHHNVFHFYSTESHRVVHEGLETADDGGVDGTLTGLVVHVLQKLQQALQPLLFNEPCHKAIQYKRGQINKEVLYTVLRVFNLLGGTKDKFI